MADMACAWGQPHRPPVVAKAYSVAVWSVVWLVTDGVGGAAVGSGGQRWTAVDR